MQTAPPESLQFSQRWRVARACARCHRLKSKCIYEDPAYSSCRRCFDLGVRCSVDEDPTAYEARKRSSSVSALLTVSKIEKLLQRAEKELEGMDTTDAVDLVAAEKFQAQSVRLHQIGSKLALLGLGNVLAGALQYPELPPGANLASHIIYTHRFLDENEARQRFDFFQQQMITYYPIISLPQKLQNFDHLLTASPLLLLTCVYVTTINDYGFSSRTANRKLNATLDHYVNTYIAHRVYVKASEFTYHAVLACMILSLWCVPPDREGQFKSQVDLITSFALSLCIDVGNVTMYDPEAVLQDDSTERNNLRSFLGLYCCAGSLAFSLPRFKLVAWSKRHELVTERLSRPLTDGVLPLRNDRFLCYYAKLIRVGQELYEYFADNGVSLHFLSSEEENGGLGSLPASAFEESGHLPLVDISQLLRDYKIKLSGILQESGFIAEDDTPKQGAPREKYALLLTYYQLMMMTHDNLMSWRICRLTAEKKNDSLKAQEESEFIVEHTLKFGEFCEKMLLCFLDLDAEGFTTYPTFFYYRALRALVSLIRLLVLVKAELLTAYFSGLAQVKFNLKSLYDRVTEVIEKHYEQYGLIICGRVVIFLQRISRWVKAVGDDNSKYMKSGAQLDFIKLTDVSKGQEIEKLGDPDHHESPVKRVKLNGSGEYRPSSSNPPEVYNKDIADLRPETHELPNYATNYSVQDIFKEIDEDVLHYLNPFDLTDTDMPATSFFNDYLSGGF